MTKDKPKKVIEGSSGSGASTNNSKYLNHGGPIRSDRESEFSVSEIIGKAYYVLLDCVYFKLTDISV